ncbi:MAG: choice-of-anchor J domain-containing protein [Bacteroidetes bacterium]|nr:choice-of-anchor J domain-containing protein [Bacteroidota bacterium]
MKKFYSLILLVVLGPLFSFGQAPFSQKTKVSALSASGKVASVKQTSHALPALPTLSAAKHVQPGNQVQFVFSDNFDLPSDTDALAARGYHTYYRGGGAQAAFPTWFTGNGTVVPSHSGAVDSYVAANYQVVSGTNNIDSWLVLPSLNLATTDIISFWCTSPTGSTFPDSVKVMYSDAGDSVPEATSWVLVDNFQASVTGWEQKIYNVPTASTTGRFAIRYAVVDGGPNGANSNYIGIDDLNVGALPADDIGMVPGYPSQYTMIPLTQALPIDLSASIVNVGGNAETNVGFTANVYLFQGGIGWTQVFNGLSATAATLNSGATTAPLSAGPFNITDTGVYAFEYISFMDNVDSEGANDTSLNYIVVTDTTYARDEAAITGLIDNSLGFNANTGNLGNIYDANTNLIVKSISFFCAAPTEAEQVTASMYSINGGLPDVNLGTSAPYTFTADDNTNGVFLTLPLPTPVAVAAGQQFYVGADQLGQSNLTLGFNSNVFTDNTVFFQVAGGGWLEINVGTGGAFIGSFLVRANLDLDNQVSETAFAKEISVFPNPSNGKLYIHNDGQKENMTVTVFNNLGQTVYNGTFSQMSTAVVDLTKESAGVYSVQVKSDKEITTKSVVISNR